MLANRTSRFCKCLSIMSIKIHDLYCDESGIDAGSSFHFGAIRCSPARSRILLTRLSEVREKYGLTSEMKWVRVSRAMLPAYKAFVSAFLDCPYSRFRLHTVERGAEWRHFGRDEDERFFKAYYVFLRLTMSLQCQYHIYVDDKPGKRHRWNNVKFAINGAVRRDHGLKKHVRSLNPTDSKSNDLIQVTDIVLGALTSVATSPHKQELMQFVRERLPPGNGHKLVVRNWTPDWKSRSQILKRNDGSS